ncbi:YdcF family protein [Roseateles sp. BYS87W]|uniref:YdcF family protein n=1 Tax=Pelomonas baiyunensis TaxID=3299026 RepID=A0ABW7H456_9BURK
MPIDYAAFKSFLLAAALPPAPLILLAAWGGFRLRRGRRAGLAMLGVALLGLWFSATDAAGELLSRAVGAPPALTRSEVARWRGQPGGAVLVLGGGVRRQAPEYGEAVPNAITAERLAYGAWLARQTGWPLGFSGGVGWTATQLKQPEALVAGRTAATLYQLPLTWAEGRSRDTRENAAQTLPLLAASGVKHVLLVTHDTHMRRALRAFQAAAQPLGVEVVPAPVGARVDALSSLDDWCPSVEGFGRVRYVLYEQLAWWAGR